MPAVGYVLILAGACDVAAAIPALEAAVPGLLLGQALGAHWPVAGWAERPDQVEAQVEALRSLTLVLDVEIAYVDWRGDPTSEDMQFDWNDLRSGRQRPAESTPFLDATAG